MSVTASDIVFYGCATMPDDDTTTNIGGAIDTTIKVVLTDIVATDQVEIVSSASGDTSQTITIYGRNAAGELIDNTVSVSGTTVVTSTSSFERILKIEMNTTATGTVTVRDQDTDTAIATLEPGITEVRRLFYLAASDVAGGDSRDYYDKFFIKNTHATLSATSAVVSEVADPSGTVSFALESLLDGTTTNGAGNNRLTVGNWSSLTFDSAAKNVANSQNLTAGSAQGVVMKWTIAAGAAAANTSVTMRLAFQSV